MDGSLAVLAHVHRPICVKVYMRRIFSKLKK